MPERKYYIYKITNNLNNKIYIGQSIEPEIRWKNHIRFSKTKPLQYIHKAISKYGDNNFSFKIIAEYLTKGDVDEAEIKFIKEFNSTNPSSGYNISPGGRKGGVVKHSEETKRLFKERWHINHPPESIKKIANSNRGRKSSDEFKKFISEFNKGNKYCLGKTQPKEVVEKRMKSLNERYGNKVCEVDGCERTDGHRINGIRYCGLHTQRISLTGTLELRERVAHNKGVSPSDEVKKKISESLKGNKPVNKIEFTEEQIKQIIFRTKSSEDIAKDFNVSRNVIKRIIREYKGKILTN